MKVSSHLRLLRFFPSSLPGKSRLARLLIDLLATKGEVEVEALGLRFCMSRSQPACSRMALMSRYCATRLPRYLSLTGFSLMWGRMWNFFPC